MSIFNKTQISKTLLYLIGGFAIATLFIPVTAGVAKASNGSDKVEVSDSNHSDSENHSDHDDDEHASNDDEYSSDDDLPFDNHGEENEDEHSGSGTSGSGAPGGGIPGGGTAGTPEPFTMLGAVSAIGFGVSFKRRLAKAKNDQKD
ncbi:MAG: PEP-CTERM sorting domain-containing protein [Snowella sp.]|nr:PEP-CTERM sorting domain-containing protein [Snowella sp.]